MQVNNSNSINFKGRYIVKGDIKSIEKFSKLIHANYIDDSCGFVNLKNPDKFWGWEEEVLIPKFTHNQDYAESLHATNDDADIVRAYRHKKFEKEEKSSEKYKDIYEYTNVLEQKQVAKLSEYFRAQFEGINSFCDFMIDKFVEGRRHLAEVMGYDVANDIKTIHAKDAIQAIKENRFDFVEGEILE